MTVDNILIVPVRGEAIPTQPVCGSSHEGVGLKTWLQGLLSHLAVSAAMSAWAKSGHQYGIADHVSLALLALGSFGNLVEFPSLRPKADFTKPPLNLRVGIIAPHYLVIPPLQMDGVEQV